MTVRVRAAGDGRFEVVEVVEVWLAEFANQVDAELFAWLKRPDGEIRTGDVPRLDRDELERAAAAVQRVNDAAGEAEQAAGVAEPADPAETVVSDGQAERAEPVEPSAPHDEAAQEPPDAEGSAPDAGSPAVCTAPMPDRDPAGPVAPFPPGLRVSHPRSGPPLRPVKAAASADRLFTEEELAVAFDRVGKGEGVKAVADSMGKNWLTLRSRWAQRCQDLARKGKGWPRRVDCMTCSTAFTSPGPGVRMCPKCRHDRASE